jgi:hypothetical protein
MSFVEKHQNGCWLWKGGKSNGYGYIWNGDIHSNVLAHRVSYTLFKGGIPDGMIVRHSCKNKCVNPEHLEFGTYSDNNGIDKFRDGTLLIGVKNPANKYTEEQVKDIRNRYKNGETQTSISQSLGIRQGHILDICLQKVWKCVV